MFLLRPQRSNRCLNMLDLHVSYTYIQVLYFQTTAGTQSLQQTSCDTLPRCGMSCYQKPRCTFTEALMYMQQLDIVVVLQGSPCKLHIINSARTLLCSKNHLQLLLAVSCHRLVVQPGCLLMQLLSMKLFVQGTTPRQSSVYKLCCTHKKKKRHNSW